MLSYRVAATIAMNGLERNCSIDRSMDTISVLLRFAFGAFFRIFYLNGFTLGRALQLHFD